MCILHDIAQNLDTNGPYTQKDPHPAGAGLRHNIKSSGRDTILDGMLGSIQHSYFGSAGEIQIESQSGLGDAVLFSFGVGGSAQTGLRSGIIIIVLRALSSRNIDLEMAVSNLRFGLEQPVSMLEPAMATAVRAVYFIKSRRENV